ncbi:MAG: Maf family protein [Proteobacteria bacterium]|nr:Maf family protein [Pseudomonadota bacterium]MDA1063563.1 Maf family protein [Pseudomonadota bacterium]
MSDRRPLLHLASASPRRAEILDALGIAFTAAGVGIDERRREHEAADAMVLRLASEKAAAARLEYAGIVLAADTVVVVDTDVLGKPRDRADALAMLARLSGRRHRVMTGIALSWGSNERTALSVTDVTFRDISPDEAIAYWQSGEPRDKAGAYAIQGLGGVFVEAISGSYTGVVGLPVFETVRLLAEAGIEVVKGAAGS